MVGLRHEEKTEVLRGLIFKTRNELKSGWPEEIYHQALLCMLQDEAIPVISRPRRAFLHRGEEVHLFEPDLIVWDRIILELKALPYQKEFLGEQYAQAIHYLKFWQKDLALLVNFGPPKVKIQRVVWDEPPFELSEEYEEIKPHISEPDRVNLQRIRQCVIALARQYGFGYPETLYRKLVAVELAHRQIDCVSDVGVVPVWTGQGLPRHTTHHLQVADHYLVHIRSLSAQPTTHDFLATRTYLRCLGLKFGLIVNFGAKELQIHGISSE